MQSPAINSEALTAARPLKAGKGRMLLFLSLVAMAALMLAGVILIPFPASSATSSQSIRARADEVALVEAAKRFVTTPPEWVARDQDSERPSKIKAWIASEPALTALELPQPSHIGIEESTLSLEWGSPVSPRWGIAISAKINSEPKVRNGAVETTRVYHSISLYSVPD